jgi:iron-sulfur cluster repair protein YtfE (RIC family)
MSIALVRELNGDHRAILAIIGRIGDIGALTPETRVLIAETRDALLRHLAKEEREFYPAIRRLASASQAIADKLRVMNSEMESIAAAAMRFLDEYATAGKPENFADDFANFRRVLSERIQREEFALYSHFLKSN